MSDARAGDALKSTCPRDCYDSCGVLVQRRGAEISVRGDPDHPVSRGRLCGKCSTAYNREWLDPQCRLTRPLRRVGAKGSGRFEPVSWEEAIAEIAQRLRALIAEHGPARILNAHYTGTISLLAGIAPMRFFNRLGSTEVLPDTICNMAGHVGLRYLLGTSLDGFDPRMAQEAACIVVWGANPHASAPHAHEHWLKECPGQVIVVDPVRTPTAAEADLHVQPFPGSDAALAFAVLKVMQRDRLIDEVFVEAHVSGFEELAPQIAACDLGELSRRTQVPVAVIERFAHTYARGPSLLWLGQGLQRQRTGGNVMRACGLLPVLSGNLGKRGAGVLYLNGNLKQRGIDEEYLAGTHLARAAAPAISHMDLAAVLADPSRARALFVWNMNPLASAPRQRELRHALEREDLLTVALELFPTDTTALADYVLPAASFLEFDDLVAAYFNLTLSAQVRAMPPLGEALPNLEIFRRLARALGFTDPEFLESDAGILATLLERSGLRETFETLARKGTIFVPAAPLVQFSTAHFPTPSGRIEVASPSAEAAGLPRLPQCWSDPPPSGGHLRLLSPADAWLLNTSFGNVERVRTRLGAPSIGLNPQDAAERGLADGDAALVHNECGRLTLKVQITDVVPRGVALSHKGRWLASDPNRANVNVLNGGEKSDMGESTAVHGVEVRVQAVQELRVPGAGDG
ncbi:MAG TPA: molybdopterin-dependent oxidoreductase [Steroidobacteraceae bacterium]|nr:molybdopterin-dependent oxidoreductase [Steroidobacteraceae bacterium]